MKTIIFNRLFLYSRIIVITYLCLSFIACNNKKHVYIEDNGEIFKTSYLVKYEYSHSLKREIDLVLADFDDSLNPFKESSIISKVNNNIDVRPDNYFTTVFNKAQQVSAVSEGLFDITISPLINAWGFGFKNMDNVTPERIDSLKRLTGYNRINIHNGKVIKEHPDIQLNASAIAKGYATDVVASLLESYGIKNYIVEIGGEIRAKGMNANDQYWRVGIDRPREDSMSYNNPFQMIIALDNKAVATSGDYRKYYINEGKRFAHTINPQTGYPADNSILSATVIADDCMTADAYATVFMLADTAQTRKLAKKQQLSYMLILAKEGDNYEIVKSEDFERYIIE